jgi:hypothetical protein
MGTGADVAVGEPVVLGLSPEEGAEHENPDVELASSVE